MNKQLLLHWAEVIDSWRIFPRLFLIGCFAWTVEVTRWLLVWYTMLPKEDRGIEASGFASIVFVAVLGFLKLVYTTYAQTGRDWSQPVSSTQTTVASTTTTVQP
jgi:hypothetical protein